MYNSEIYGQLRLIQSRLKAPKGQYNSFGKYKYRSCEDILEAVKPILSETGCTLILSDSIECFGNRFYVKATATIYDGSGNHVENVAFAREDEQKKGMDGSQITGTASSYARKYALNGLLLIDDTKDADTDEYKNQSDKKQEMKPEEPEQPAYPNRNEMLREVGLKYPNGEVRNKLLAALKVESLEKMSDAQLMAVYNRVARK